MQKSNFKSAEELGISDELRGALIATLGMLEAGAIAAEEFKMRDWPSYAYVHGSEGCWSGGCIGAWAEHIMGRAIEDGDVIWEEAKGLDGLFYPSNESGPLCPYKATPRQGAAALWNYLTSGEGDWDKVMRRAQ